ncbi:MAG: papain-like cysteine protease family protein, partial [Burkholderiales bacterium]
MGVVSYEVPLVTQESNPICWVASMAMVASERTGSSIGIGKYANGFDPSNSSICNPAADIGDFYRRLKRCGFRAFAIEPKVVELEKAMDKAGPLILSHFCKGFPYGGDWPAISDAGAAHAVVLTAI